MGGGRVSGLWKPHGKVSVFLRPKNRVLVFFNPQDGDFGILRIWVFDLPTRSRVGRIRRVGFQVWGGRSSGYLKPHGRVSVFLKPEDRVSLLEPSG